MTAKDDHQSPLDPKELDYWTFIKLALATIGERIEDPDPMAAELIITLNRATNQVIYDLESVVHRPRGLSWSAFRLLFVLWLAGPIQPGQAAKLTGMGRAAVSQLTRTLVSKGLVRKVSSADDARAILLELTAEGQEHARQAYSAQNERESQWTSSLTDIEQKMLVLLLQKLMSSRDHLNFRIRE